MDRRGHIGWTTENPLSWTCGLTTFDPWDRTSQQVKPLSPSVSRRQSAACSRVSLERRSCTLFTHISIDRCDQQGNVMTTAAQEISYQTDHRTNLRKAVI